MPQPHWARRSRIHHRTELIQGGSGDAHTGKAIAELGRHDRSVAAVAFSTDGAAFATTGAEDGALRIRDAVTGAPIATCDVRATAIAWSPDNSCIAAGSQDGTVLICDARTGEQIDKLTHVTPTNQQESDPSIGFGSLQVAPEHQPSPDHSLATGNVEVKAVTWIQNGKVLVTGCSAGVITFWDSTTGEEVYSDIDHTGPINSLTSNPTSDHLVSAGADGVVRLLSVEHTADRATFYNESVSVNRAALSPNGTKLAWGDAKGKVKLWDAQEGELLQVIEAHIGPVAALAWSGDGDRLVSGGGVDGKVTRGIPGRRRAATSRLSKSAPLLTVKTS